MHVLQFPCDDVHLSRPVCVIITMIVTIHAGKSIMTNTWVSRTMHHCPAYAVLGHST